MFQTCFTKMFTNFHPVLFKTHPRDASINAWGLTIASASASGRPVATVSEQQPGEKNQAERKNLGTGPPGLVTPNGYETSGNPPIFR